MSGITSTIHDSGRVYLFERNALPKNFIEAGMKLSFSGLNVAVAAGTCDIAGKYHELAEAANITLPQRRANLLYAAKSDLYDAPTLGYVSAAFPAADADTVCRWIIEGSATIASTVGSNNLTKTGTVTQVNGWAADYAGQGDGSSGYYTSANSTGFPTGAAVRAIEYKYTYTGQTGIRQSIGGYGSGTGYFSLETSAASDNLNLVANGTLYNTGFSLSVGQTYFISFQYDGTNIMVFINGMKVYTLAIVLTTVATTAWFLMMPGNGFYCKGILHYVDIRNALHTPAQIAAISNALLLPCRYHPTYTDGTTIGDMTDNGRQGAAFDGNPIQDNNNAAVKLNATSAYIGKNWGESRRVLGCTIYPSSNNGFHYEDFSGLTISLKGTNDGSTWTTIGSTVLTADQASSVYVPVGTVNAFQRHAAFLDFTEVIASTIYCAECIFHFADIYTDIRAILPADSIALGFARTDASQVIKADDSSYKYGRREGAWGGNRRVFLGWQYTTGGTTLYWGNPFGTRKVKLYIVYASDAQGTDETRTIENPSGSGYNGVVVNGPSNGKISVWIPASSGVLAIVNGANKTSGYIGCYAEVIE